MKKTLLLTIIAALALASCGGGTTNQNVGTTADTAATTVETPQCDVSTQCDVSATTDSAPEPQKVDKKVEITLEIIKQLWMGVPDSVLIADNVALNDTITNFYYTEEADEFSDVEFDFELNLDCYFYTKKSGGYKVLVFSSSFENRARHRWINSFTCKDNEVTEDEMFNDNTGYVQFEMYNDGKFWVADYIPGEEVTYQFNGEKFVRAPESNPVKLGAEEEISEYDKPLCEKIKKLQSKLPSAYADSVYVFDEDSGDGDNRRYEKDCFFPYKNGGYLALMHINECESGYCSVHDRTFVCKDGVVKPISNVLPEPDYSDFLKGKNPEQAQLLKRLTDYFSYDYYEGILSVDVVADGLEEREQMADIEDYKTVNYKWNGEQFVMQQ